MFRRFLLASVASNFRRFGNIFTRFKNLLVQEEDSGNANVFYNPQDLTSLRVETDGSGGNPTVGDPVGVMLDTSGLSGSMEEFLAAQPELVTNGTFDTDTDWTKAAGWTISGGVATSNGTAGSVYQSAITVGKVYSVTWEITSISSGQFVVNLGGGNLGTPRTSVGTYTDIVTAGDNIVRILSQSGVGSIDNISVKEIPGYHAVAPTDAARPTLMDDPDTTWASLTDDGTRGEELVTNGDGADTTGWSTVNSAILTSNGSVFRVENGAASFGRADQSFAVEIGAEYEITAEIISLEGSAGGSIRFGTSAAGLQYAATTGVNSISTTVRALTSTMYFSALPNTLNLGDAITFDNISVRKVNTAFDERGTTELVTNGDFSDGTTGWTLGAGWSVSNGVATHTGATPGYLDFSGVAVEGRHYEITYDIVAVSGGAYISPYLGSSPGIAVHSTVGTHTASGIATGTAFGFALRGVSGASASISVTNISVREVLYPNLLIQVSNFAHLQDDDSTFDTDTGNWTKGTGWSIGSGVATISPGTAGVNFLSYALSASEANKWYRVRYYVPRYVAGQIRPYVDTVGYLDLASSTGWHETYFRRSTSATFKFVNSNPADDYDIDNVIVQELPSTTPTSYYLDCDGTDDWMQVTPTLNLGEQWWHTGAWQCDVAGTAAFAATNDFRGRLFALSGGQGWNYRTADDGNAEIVDGDIFQKHIATVEKSDTNSINGRYNGGSAVIITPYDTSAQTQGLALFTQYNLGASIPLDGRFYGGAWGQGQVDYDELTTLQDYLGTLVEPDIDPTDVTSYANVYEMLSAQTAAALFDIDDTTSLRVGRDGSGGVPVDGDPVGMMMDVSGAGGSTMAAYLAGATELVTNGTFDTDVSSWSAANATVAWSSGEALITGNAGGFGAIRQTITSIPSGEYALIEADIRLGTATQARLVAENALGGSSAVTVTADGRASLIAQSDGNFNARVDVGGSATGSTIYVDNVSVKELPGYVATAPSDAARPTLASVLDETASELTDDGTRSAELVTNGSFDTDSDWSKVLGATIANGVASLPGGGGQVNQTAAVEIGAEYEVTYTSSNKTGAGSTRISFGGVNGTLRGGEGTYTETIRAISAGNAVVAYLGGSGSDSVDIDNVSIKKVQTVFDGRGDELEGSVFSPSALNDGELLETQLGNQVEAGKNYEVKYTWANNTAGGFFQLRMYNGTDLSDGLRFELQSQPSGSYTERWIPASSGTIQGRWFFASATGDVDVTISVKEVLTPNLLLTSAGDDNSTFDTAGDWSVNANWSISGGVATASPVSSGYIFIDNIITPLKWYKVSAYVTSYTAGYAGFVDALFDGDTVQSGTRFDSVGWHTAYIRPKAGQTRFQFYAPSHGDLSIDNMILQEVPASVARAHYLDFDGSDDNLILDGTDFGSSTNATLYKTFRGDSSDTQQIMFASNSWYAIVSASGSASAVLNANIGSPVFREDGAIASYATRGDAFTALVDNTDHTIGVEEADLTNTLWGSTGFYIGGEYDVTSDNTGRLYAWAAVDTRLDGRNRDLLENFMLSKKTS